MDTKGLTPDALKALNARFEQAPPEEIIRWAVETFRPAVALTSSFGADSAALIHMALQVDPRIEIRTIDTGVLFPETYEFMESLKRRFHLNLVVTKSRLNVKQFLTEHAGEAPGTPGFCCDQDKVEAMERSLAGLRGWIPVDRGTLQAAERVFALGDAVDLPVPKSGAAAHYQARIVAANIRDEIEGRSPGSGYDGRVT